MRDEFRICQDEAAVPVGQIGGTIAQLIHFQGRLERITHNLFSICARLDSPPTLLDDAPRFAALPGKVEQDVPLFRRLDMEGDRTSQRIDQLEEIAAQLERLCQ